MQQAVQVTQDTEEEAGENPLARLAGLLQAGNIAEVLDDQHLARIGRKVCEEFEIDERSRDAEGWTERTKEAMKLALQVKETKNYPWPNASNIKYPLVATAAIQFNARAYPAIVDGSRVVKSQTWGADFPQKQARADRIADHMSYQLTEEMVGWEEDTDRMLVMLPIVGCMIRKTWFDPALRTNRSESISPDKFVVNYWTKSLDTCPRMTQVLDDIHPHQAEERFRAGLWRKIDLGIPEDADGDEDAPHTFLEQHRLLDLDEDGYPEPYIVTVHKETERVVRIVARFDPEGVEINEKGEVARIVPVSYYTKYAFIPAPDGSFYDIGFGQLLGSINATIDSTFNQLMDAGHLANTQGGFLGGGISIKSGALRFQPGEWKKVPVEGGRLADNILPLPAKEPSLVLFQLLGLLIEAAREITATKDILTGDQGQSTNTPVGTTLALIEQGLKVFTAIYKRIHRGLKAEFGKLYRLNRLYLSPQAYFTFQDRPGVIAQADYAEGDCDVVPVSDPTVVSDMQKMGRAQFLLQFRTDPLMNGQEINRRVLEAASIPDVDGLFAAPAPDPALEVKKAELQQKQDELDRKSRELAVRETEALAKVTKLYADTLSALSKIGQGSTGVDPATGETVERPAPSVEVPPQAMEMLTALASIAHSELDGAKQEEANAAEIQPGEPGGMAGAPADAGVPAVPEGPAIDTGESMGVGGADAPGIPGQGPVDGGVGGLGVG